MGRFLAILGAFVLIGMVAVYMGWFGFSSSATTDGSHEKLEITMDNAKIKSDTAKITNEVKDLSQKTGNEVHDIAVSVESRFSSSKTAAPISIEKKTIEIEPGASVKVKVTRNGTDLPALHLILTPSPSSNLLATGGEFKATETETFIVIEALSAAKDGSVNVDGNGDSQRIDVVLKGKI